MVYILQNKALAAGVIKIGCSRRSGAARADELNREAGTGMPARFQCVAQFQTTDCRRAEGRVHQHFKEKRLGKRGQEFFEVGLEEAKSVIAEVCRTIDAEVARAHKTAGAGAAPAATMNPAAVVERGLNANMCTASPFPELTFAPFPAPLPPSAKSGISGWVIALAMGYVVIFILGTGSKRAVSPHTGSTATVSVPPGPAAQTPEKAPGLSQATEENSELQPQPRKKL